MDATIKAKSPAGFEIIFKTPELENRVALLEALTRFEVELLELGFTPTAGQTIEVNVEQPAAMPAPALPAPAAGPLSFLVDKITATIDDGKVYWRVKGGEFQKFGVIVYEEVLEAAGLSEINPLKPFSEPGLVAYYSTKEDGIKPKKVTRLERANN
jgi:hypothetical protein